MLLNKFCYRKYKLFDKISFLKDVSNMPEKKTKNKKQKKLKKQTNKQTNKKKQQQHRMGK